MGGYSLKGGYILIGFILPQFAYFSLFISSIKDKILSSIRNFRDLPEYVNWNGIQSYNFVTELSEKYPQYEFLTQINDHLDYVVSNYGNVLSYHTSIWIVRELSIRNDYFTITLTKNNIDKLCRVHVLIIEAFMPIKLDVDFQIVNHDISTKIFQIYQRCDV